MVYRIKVGLLTCFMFTYTLGGIHSGNKSTCSDHALTVKTAAFFDCLGENGIHNKWKQNGKVFYINRYFMDNTLKDKFLVFENYSILIETVLLDYEGNYECIRDSVTVKTHNLRIKGLFLFGYFLTPLSKQTY